VPDKMAFRHTEHPSLIIKPLGGFGLLYIPDEISLRFCEGHCISLLMKRRKLYYAYSTNYSIRASSRMRDFITKQRQEVSCCAADHSAGSTRSSSRMRDFITKQRQEVSCCAADHSAGSTRSSSRYAELRVVAQQEARRCAARYAVAHNCKAEHPSLSFNLIFDSDKTRPYFLF
jgi:hypothetical protein